ncbi:MAG: hypothetical protein RR150_12420 [Clostridia bacterium]
MKIDTGIMNVVVEIDDVDYPVAQKTVATAERLKRAEEAATGKKAQYELWLEQLEILLGRAAVKKLFPGGKAENLDRMERIYLGVSDAFDDIGRKARTERSDRAIAQIEELTRELKPLSDLLAAISAKHKMIERPEQT